MTERTASEIRAYCEALEYGWSIAKTPAKRRAYAADWGFNARTDLPRVLEAAVELWKARYFDIGYAINDRHEGHISEREIHRQIRTDPLLSKYAWLEVSDDRPADGG